VKRSQGGEMEMGLSSSAYERPKLKTGRGELGKLEGKNLRGEDYGETPPPQETGETRTKNGRSPKLILIGGGKPARKLSENEKQVGGKVAKRGT